MFAPATIADRVLRAIAQFYGAAAQVNQGVGPEINRVNVFSVLTDLTTGDGVLTAIHPAAGAVVQQGERLFTIEPA